MHLVLDVIVVKNLIIFVKFNFALSYLHHICRNNVYYSDAIYSWVAAKYWYFLFASVHRDVD